MGEIPNPVIFLNVQVNPDNFIGKENVLMYFHEFKKIQKIIILNDIVKIKVYSFKN